MLAFTTGPLPSAIVAPNRPRIRWYVWQSEDLWMSDMNEAVFNSYHLGRPLTKLESPYTGEDSTFAGQRLDSEKIRQARYRHCTFVNVSLKAATLDDCGFADCIFIGCYFRRTTLKNCRFEGCRFYECDFPRVSLSACRLYYVRFIGCQLPADEMEHSLPSEPNVREKLCRNLARESSLLGFSEDARRYRKWETDAHEEHLKSGFTSHSDWYRSHFVGSQKLLALRRWTWSKLNRFLWGYCDSGTRLIFNFLSFTILIFPFLYWLLVPSNSSNTDELMRFANCILLSLSTATPADFPHEVGLGSWELMLLMSIQSMYSVVLVAMFAAFLFQWSSRR